MSGQFPPSYGTDSDAYRDQLLELAKSGDETARDELLQMYWHQLEKMVAIRIDQRLAQRIDPSDVVQEATMEAARRLPDYLANPTIDFYVWMRWITRDRLIDLHREHLHALRRNAGRDISIDASSPDHSAGVLAGALVGHLTSPSNAASRTEMASAIRQAIGRLDDEDQEILILRHFEQLTIRQAAKVLGLSKSGTGKRHILALRKLRSILATLLPGYQ